MTPPPPADIYQVDTCAHEVVPIDANWGRCTKCGDNTFPLSDEAAWGGPRPPCRSGTFASPETDVDQLTRGVGTAPTEAKMAAELLSDGISPFYATDGSRRWLRRNFATPGDIEAAPTTATAHAAMRAAKGAK